MRLVKSSQTISIPKGVTVDVKARKIKVTGPRGTLNRDLTHLNVDIHHNVKAGKITVEVWFGNKAETSCIKTAITHIENCFTGVLKGFEYKMRFVYAHFPINVVLSADGSVVDIRNFLGEKRTDRIINLPTGVKAVRSDKVKDEIVISGNDIDAVSTSAAQIHQICAVKHKDIRKFLDGIYVSEKGVIGAAVPV
eukprot:TRINITY_DN212_c0_g1_i1.p1 TRINITY_DN212_c0_g1~~TRINITY_DN212_c0_g1_i1.p1  ORF type:complete len:194 (-),score=37.44 TRINITY_DN212_c0_g1_i1:82-663(-)